jgi:hypothetical protein
MRPAPPSPPPRPPKLLLRYALMMAVVYGLTYLALDLYFATETQYRSLRADLPWIILAVYAVSVARRYFFGRKQTGENNE